MSSDDNQIIQATTFNCDEDCKYLEPKVNKSGGKSVGILNSKSNSALFLSTPFPMLCWGVTEFVDEQTGRKAYNMCLQFPQEGYETDETKAFLQNILKLESKIKDDCVTYSKKWMNKTKMEPVVVNALWHPMLKYPKDPNTGEPDYNRAPNIKIKLDYWDDAFNCEIYDLEQKPLFQPGIKTDISPMDLIPKASQVALVMRCGGLWFANGKFGCTWRLQQAVVKPKMNMTGKCFIKLSSEEINKLKDIPDVLDEDEDDVKESIQSSTVAEDSDDDTVQDEVVEEIKAAIEPAEEKPKKKVVRRTKKVE